MNGILMQMDKIRRHKAILRLLKHGPVIGQERLRRQLAEAGITATQATISRDMRELGAIKTPTGYILRESLSEQPPTFGDRALELSISAFLVAVDVAGTLVVLKTEPGHAQALAASLDGRNVRRVVGSIAGDDTIFLATRSAKDAAFVLRDLQRLAGDVGAAALTTKESGL